MRYILVWWIIHPGHSQVLHFEHFASETACTTYAAQLQAPNDRPIRKHCSME